MPIARNAEVVMEQRRCSCVCLSAYLLHINTNFFFYNKKYPSLEIMVEMDWAHVGLNVSLMKRTLLSTLIRNVVLRRERPALLLLKTRKPDAGRANRRNTGDPHRRAWTSLGGELWLQKKLRITVVVSPFDRANDQKWPWIFSITTIWTRAAHMTILLISGTTISGWQRWSRRITSSTCLRTPTRSPSHWRRLWVWTIPRRVRA